MSVCDTIAVLDFGKLIAWGTPREVQADAAVTDAYLGAERAHGDPPHGDPPHEDPPRGDPPPGEQAHG
jgi:ABC-type hemin transport system ATPase subunit